MSQTTLQRNNLIFYIQVTCTTLNSTDLGSMYFLEGVKMRVWGTSQIHSM